jgi:hypothetical protein
MYLIKYLGFEHSINKQIYKKLQVAQKRDSSCMATQHLSTLEINCLPTSLNRTEKQILKMYITYFGSLVF